MKIKLFLVILLLLSLAGAIFYFGWVQIMLPQDSYAVIFTKLNGYLPETIPAGRFYWTWENLIPTNADIMIFKLEPRETRLEVSGELPSAELYSGALEGNPDFSYSLSFSLRYRLKPEKLRQEVEENHLRGDNLDGYYARREEEIKNLAAEFIGRRIDNGDFPETGLFPYRESAEAFMAYLAEEYPALAFDELIPGEIRIPDMALYRKGRDTYFYLADVRRESEAQTIRRAREEVVREGIKLETLREYGQIFSEYPVLLDYYKIRNRDGEPLLPEMELPLKEKAELLEGAAAPR